MHPAIADFPFRHFYGGQVSSGTKAVDRLIPAGFPWPSESIPVAFVSVSDVSSYGNPDLDEEYDDVDVDVDSDVDSDSDGQSVIAASTASARSQLESRGGNEASTPGSAGSAALGTSFCNRREAAAIAVALEMIVAGGDVEVGAGSFKVRKASSWRVPRLLRRG